MMAAEEKVRKAEGGAADHEGFIGDQGGQRLRGTEQIEYEMVSQMTSDLSQYKIMLV